MGFSVLDALWPKRAHSELENRDLGRIEAALREKQRQTEEEIRLLKCQRRALA